MSAALTEPVPDCRDGQPMKQIAEEASARAALRRTSDAVARTLERSATAMKNLRDLIVLVRPSGLLTVGEMAEAIEHDRNYVDSVWSIHGETKQDPETGRVVQTRVKPLDGSISKDERYERAYKPLVKAAKAQRDTAGAYASALAERNRTVAMIYASKILGPTDIGREIGVDRNHVLRISRKQGVAPVHRTDTRNQYSGGTSKGRRRKRKKAADPAAPSESA